MKIIGIGTDIISKERLQGKCDLVNHFLNNDEKQILDNINDEEGKLDFISGRWAAKEAIIKASNKKYAMRNISVLKSESGKPIVKIDGLLNENIEVSISHEKEYSMAFSIIIKV